MLEINAQAFMNAVKEIRHVQDVIEHLGEEVHRQESVPSESRQGLLSQVEQLTEAVRSLHARACLVAVDRLRTQLQNDAVFSWRNLRDSMADIEGRLHDELGFVRLFVLDPNQSRYLLQGADLLGEIICDRFPSVIFEMEESARCLALGRPTASCFHSMRALEVAIKSLAKYLQIADPTKPAERNWGRILSEINRSLDAAYPKNSRTPNSEGAKVESLYASLDAVKNPWRNATMHVESIYQPHEAAHILQCVNHFILQLSSLCDENGLRIPDSQADMFSDDGTS